MATLPTPGGDSNTWGTELNEWLLVGHETDGTTIGGGGGGGDTVLFDQELSSPSATFDATGLSQDYDHLRMVLLSRGTHSSEDVQIRMRFNGDTGSNYEFVHFLAWQGNQNLSAEGIAQGFIRLGSASGAVSDAGIYVSTIVDIPFYTSGAHKTTHFDQVSKNDSGTNGMYVFTGVGSWIDTDPITQITLYMDNGNFDTGSRLMIYGVGGEVDSKTVQLQVTDANGDALETGDGQGWFLITPQFDGWNLTSVTGAVTTVSSSGPVTVQIRNETQSNVNMLTTPLTVDASERTSATAAAAVVDAANDDVATGDFLFVDIDAAGTGAKGLIVTLTFEAP